MLYLFLLILYSIQNIEEMDILLFTYIEEMDILGDAGIEEMHIHQISEPLLYMLHGTKFSYYKKYL